MSVDHAPETGTTASGSAAKVTGASIENLSQREASERHVPVMLDRCINLLAPGIERAVEERGTAYVIDGTLGMGGHSEALLERFENLVLIGIYRYLQAHAIAGERLARFGERFENLVLIGIDRDLQAHAIAGERLARFGDRFVPVHAVYDEIDRAMETAGVQGIDGILMDLGVSSMQLDERTRGFAYSYDAPLDMRMNSEDELTARIVVNEYSEDQLRRIIRNWGEEKFASRIARAICTARANAPLETTGELVRIIQKAVPVAAQRTGGHPAKRTFQALRIEVNHELEALERAVPAALEALNLGGRFIAQTTFGDDIKKLPEEGALASLGQGFCLGEDFTKYVGIESGKTSYQVEYLTPGEGTWAQGDRKITCVVTQGDKSQVKGSAKNSKK